MTFAQRRSRTIWAILVESLSSLSRPIRSGVKETEIATGHIRAPAPTTVSCGISRTELIAARAKGRRRPHAPVPPLFSCPSCGRAGTAPLGRIGLGIHSESACAASIVPPDRMVIRSVAMAPGTLPSRRCRDAPLRRDLGGPHCP